MEREKPWLIRGALAGGGEKTVRADGLRTAKTPFHEKLTDAQTQKALELWNRVGRLLLPGQTSDKWVDDFRFEMHPDRELAAYEHIAATFEAVRDEHPKGKWREIIRVIVLISMGTVDPHSQTRLPRELVSRLRSAYGKTDDHLPQQVIDPQAARPKLVEDLTMVDVIYLFNKRTNEQALAFGSDTLQRISSSGQAADATIARVPVDPTDAAQLEQALAAIVQAKGRHDFNGTWSPAE